MGRVKRFVRFWTAHVVPRRHVTAYVDGAGVRAVAMWRQWGRRVWDHQVYPLSR